LITKGNKQQPLPELHHSLLMAEVAALTGKDNSPGMKNSAR
jgi:hypothetical protein